jgi:Tfp pilus assembly pilus retraction ATPase PilT
VQSLYNEIVLGERAGMITLEASLAGLVKAGAIAREQAEIRTSHLEELESLLRA